MRELKIAYGSSCFAKVWSNKTITFDALCERLKNTIRTPETVEEYPKLSKAERDRAKDKGGMVGGWLKQGRRKAANVECRSMLTHDIDSADSDFLERYHMLNQYASCLYSTHSHTPEAPRYANGGRVTHEHFKHCNLAYRAKVLAYISNLPLNLQVSANGTDYLLVHGAPASTYTKGSRYANQTEHAVWTRLGRNTPLSEDKIVIFGHTPTHHYNHVYPMAIWHGRNRIGIDCGCAWGTDGRLGCLRLDDMQEFYSEEGV